MTLQRGFDITRAQQSEGDIPVVSSSGINSYHNRAMVNGPGVVIGRKGSLGTCFLVPVPFWPHDTTLWVKDFKGNDPTFCYYFLRAMDLGKYDVGSANPTLNRNHVHLLPTARPPLVEQRHIAKILKAYDDLIEVNQRRVTLLEEMARSLYEEWFVRFRFPGHETAALVGTPSGLLPHGWAWVRFDDLVHEVRDAVSPAAVRPDIPYVGLEHLPRRSTTLNAFGTAAEVASTKLRFTRGDVLFGKIRPYFHKVVWAPFDGVASSDAIVFRPRAAATAAVALCVASSDPFVAHSVQTSNGTKMPRANPTVLKSFLVALGPPELTAQFARSVDPMTKLAASLQAANHRLASARDLLLPRLISGQLSVIEVERELAQAA